jgi:hypothetical protein
MKVKKVNVNCGCCGKEYERLQIMSFFGPMLGPSYLDGQPSEKSGMLSRYERCDSCNYIAKDITEVPNEKIKEIINSSKYQKLCTISRQNYSLFDPNVKYNAVYEIEAFLMINDDIESQIIGYRDLCWNYELINEHRKASEARFKFVELLKTIKINNFNTELTFIDSLRQLGRFAEAKEEVKKAKKLIDSKKTIDGTKLLKVEKKLIAKNDSDKHLINEFLK